MSKEVSKRDFHFLDENDLCRGCGKTKEQLIEEADDMPFIPKTPGEFTKIVEMELEKEELQSSETKSKVHTLKVYETGLGSMYYGVKTFDVRKGRRDINIGDTVVFVENGTNRQFSCKVKFVLKSWEVSPQWGWDMGDFIVFSWRLGDDL